eukprot:CAMPEP_0178491962 /NCGR_PEP_ID=MMETSP0696-20121128/11685_1 /TAXON_ID=265572 /ORGANISM="Extubocellulus spinifer, Strain CCMP396" /LENGTH=4359 /DNA_ID=CAMNT_0020119857 /DNA_START=116 /DNA_END=13193 /DNA_ORIENTATION=+
MAGGAAARPISPEGYIQGACELHLQARVLSVAGKAAISKFLAGGDDGSNQRDGGESNADDSNAAPIPRLFVWVPRTASADGSASDVGSEEGWAAALASTETLDGNNAGAIAFINTAVTTASSAGGASSAQVRTASQLQCMTICPRIYEEEKEEGDKEKIEAGGGGDTGADAEASVAAAAAAAASSSGPGSATFLSLQMYARHCFVPAVQAIEAIEDEEKKDSYEKGGSEVAIDDAVAASHGRHSAKKKSRVLEGLEDKIRELDVALGQCRRSTLGQIPHVVLSVHPTVIAAAAKIPPSGKIDMAELGLAEKIDDDAFLNEVQAGVSLWIGQIRKVTMLPATTPFPSGSDEETEVNADLEEVSFWTELEVALKHIRGELSKPEVVLTLAMLKEAKRFLATIALENNSGLDAAEAHTTDVANYLKSYPIEPLAAARDMGKVGTSMDSIFEHIPRIRQSRFYDLERCARLLEATTLTLRQRMEAILRDQNKANAIVLELSFEQYEKDVRFPTQDIFVRFEDSFDTFKEFLLEQGRRKRVASSTDPSKTPAQVVKSIVLYHQVLRERLDAVHTFRVQHKKLQSVVTEVLTGDDRSDLEIGISSSTDDAHAGSMAIREVEEAPASVFAGVDILDLSPRGKIAFQSALEKYDRKVDAVEEKLAKLLRDKLTSAQDAEDMFRVFARFNPLLTRTRVRSAVKEFQMELISTVGQAIERLQGKFTQKYDSSPASRMSGLRGIPPVSGKILWAKQMERQVDALMKRMGDVLGPDWGQQLEGRGLRRSGDELLTKLDAKSFFRSWVSEWERDLSTNTNSRLNSYPIVIVPEGRNNALVAKINYDEKHENLFREIRHLSWLGYDRDIPRTLAIISEEALGRYPHAMNLKTALRSYTVARELIPSELEPLVKPQLLAVQESVAEAFDVSLDGSKVVSKRRVRWDAKDMSDWVAGLTEHVNRFEERVETLLYACDKIDTALESLGKVEYDVVKLQHILEGIQKHIDELSLAGYSDLASWVDVVDSRISNVLAERLEAALKEWDMAYQIKDSVGDEEQGRAAGDGDASTQARRRVRIPPIMVEILLRNQEISASPSVPVVREIFLKELHDYMAIVCSLPRPTSERFEVFGAKAPNDGANRPSTYDHLVASVSPETLASAYGVIERCVQETSAFVSRWLAYQTLWDTRVGDVSSAVGEDMEKWNALISEATEARTALDSVATIVEFGPIFVKYDKVQSQINLKYDSWQKELQSSYAVVLGQQIRDLHDKISVARNKLESVALESSGAPTPEIVLGVTFLQEMKQVKGPWAKEIEKLSSSERILKRQRHAFDAEWMESSRAIGQFQQFEQLLGKKSRTMDEQVPLLQSRVVAEDKVSLQRSAELMSEWEDQKPLRGDLGPEEALNVLTNFEFNLKKAVLDHENLIKAKDALGLEAVAADNALSSCLDELCDIKEVWEAMSKPYDALNELKDITWASASMRKVRKGLDDILMDLRTLPNRIRQYDAFTHLHDMLKKYQAGQSLLSDMKTEALKDRHWKTIQSRLAIRLPFSELTIGLLWDHGILDRKREIVDVLTVAQGEMALEVFLEQVRDRWMKQELELVLYQNRVRLIRGWDNLFTGLDDHMGGLVLMRSSPYYRSVREFQEEGKLWEDRLTKLRGAFDAWVDVQRRWVYLEGIFFGSADIKAQLPGEWSRFKSVDGEFVALMRRISGRPYALEVLNIENVQRTLERLGNLMNVIQRALGEYLERQRSDFSRFYFLGDDDLLEIIGNSGEPVKVLSHIGKMFAGMASARIDSSASKSEGLVARFDAMVSKDGEVVPLVDPIDVAPKLAVKEWLRQLEDGMHTTLAKLLQSAVEESETGSSQALATTPDEGKKRFVEWAKKFPAQIMILATLINWSMGVDEALRNDGGNCGAALRAVLSGIEEKLKVMAESVLLDMPSDVRKKFEQLITELVHQRNVTRSLIEDEVCSPRDFRWLYHLRFNYVPTAPKLTEKLRISLSNSSFYYGFEYLGIGERLVQTPLTDRCYLTLTQALRFRMGGNPFGPAGTGKTETVKSLGAQLGRFVVVMNCDETFDFSAMGRLFCGLCQVGAWGCFDEFNRLEERILSAVSQQILTIQRGLLERQGSIELLGRSIKLHENVGIFVTMNPGYAGRSNLPDNLKTLFRSVAMVVPDRKLIAQVMLYSQGIVTAEDLSGKIVDIFLKCEAQMSKQSHYDFGLRALKTLLVSAGGLKRRALDGQNVLEGDELALVEKNVLIQGACNNVVPKLVAEDLSVFEKVLEEVFPGSEIAQMEDDALKAEVLEVCKKWIYVPGDKWVQKLLQLKQVLEMRHGVMAVGSSGVGKSSALRVLLVALEKIDGVKGEMYVIDPKAMNKEALFGVLDATTMEWTDGVFTSILRTILSNQKGEADKRHWVVFDGDVDPEWAENLNSVLDDNKLLTLPSGERLGIPDNMRIILEVDSLKQATPATVSRCGMIWFSNDTLSDAMRLQHLLDDLLTEDISGVGASEGEELPSAHSGFLDATKHMFVSEDERVTSIVADALDFALSRDHIMTPTRERLLTSLKALVVKGIQEAIEYDENHPDFPMSGEHMDNFAKRWVLHSLVWSFAGSASWAERSELSEMLLRTSGMILPGGEGTNLTDYRVRSSDGEYELWSESVPRMEIESHKVTATDVVIATTDTVRHTEVLGSWLSSRKPLILCGPAGSGKSMTTNSVLQDMQGIVLASLNFSSRTTPEIILKTFDQYCSYVRRGKDTVLEPMENLGAQSWLVIFCDEINLPEEDTYGTQRVIMFMRQLVEQGGFWRNDNTWVKIDRIQFVGACNPPTDAGRVNMSQRFLRHAPLLLVDFPATDSLKQIYRTFNGGMMKLFPDLKGETEPLTEAMVELYSEAKEKFKPEAQPQYFYSPRELSRWVRGIYESIVDQDQGLTKEELVRIWAHEGLRLFCDRLVEVEERKWCEEKVDNVARKWFAAVDHDKALARPLFYSTWLSKDTRQVSRDELRDFLAARLRVFYEEQLDVPLVIFDEVLEHILRIDRVLRQPMGHCLLVGDSGAGKTVLSKFVSWMNGLNIFQIKAHSRYGIDEFNEDLRGVMRRVGIDGEKVCFIFDEGNILGSGFLEAMNALLASGEVPGLFEGDEYTALMSACRDSAARDGVILDSDEELWRRFTSIVQRNLHVVFTMNPSGGDWKNRSTASPALFNRCVVDWFGTWSAKAMGEVGKEFTMKLDMGDAESVGGSWGIGDGEVLMENVAGAFEGVASGGLRQAVVGALVEMHSIVKSMADEVAHAASSVSRTFLSPRDYLALIRNFVDCVNFRREEVEDEQLHVNAGLSKLTQTQENVAELRVNLAAKTSELRQKEVLANKKLQQMVGDQNIAEKRKEEAELMSENVAKQQEQIDARKAEAQRDLDDAEPALIAAQTSVKSIKKRDLDEIRNLARPPNNVKLTLECVAIMLGEKKTEWVDIRKLISKTEFIPSILSFDADTLSDRQVKIVDSGYLTGNADLTVESVTRSSKACGPLYKWAESQVKYSSVYNRVEPLRQEVEQLEQEAQVAKDEKLRIEKEVAELESSISQYKDDYAALIRDVEALKSESEVVTKKVDRAESLIKSLSQESERWSKSKETFQNILRSLVGDGLLMAAFLTYSGFFDFRGRIVLMKRWREVLDALGIEYREGLSMVESLSKASERLEWESLGLPSDALSLENGVVLEHCVRFPLIIDPSGQAIDFIMNRYKGEKIQSTSFLDKAFMKTLAGAVRFGTTLLVENVESVDPVLNPILNKEIQRTGGRSLVRIGTEDVDYSPKFNIILTTKNPAAKLTPDLCSRVTLVNFTVTPASLQSQSMSRIMQEEKPQVEARRKDILKLQGEQNVKLRELEEKMLNMISAVEGSILDDDRVVTGMETLMKEGAQVEEQIAESADVMKEVQRAISAFEPLGSTCRELFILLTAMRDISFLYEFSATAFMSILECVLVKMGPVEGSDEKERASQLKLEIFTEAAARIGRSLSAEDKMVFGLHLARLFSKDDSIVDGSKARSLSEISSTIENLFGDEFPWQGRGLNCLHTVVESDVTSAIPLLLCSAPGHDVSGRVEAMAREHHKELSSVAMGSAEGFDTAAKILGTASKRGTWVLLKNCHLCTEWLAETLVKKLHSLGAGAHKDFRLFLTSEISPKLPTGLLRLSDVIVAEAPTGVKASISRFVSRISSDRFESAVTNRIYLVLAWVHAVIQERLCYIPAGWTERYEFTEADAIHALDAIDTLISDSSEGRGSIDPEKLPWDAMRATLCRDIFGGRVTKQVDQEVLDNLVDSVFVCDCFNVNFKLADADGAPTLPDGTSKDECFAWIESLPSHTLPTWIGLDANAEEARAERIAKSVLKNVGIVEIARINDESE